MEASEAGCMVNQFAVYSLVSHFCGFGFEYSL